MVRWWRAPTAPLRVVITGSSKGIGKALAREFLRCSLLLEGVIWEQLDAIRELHLLHVIKSMTAAVNVRSCGISALSTVCP